MHGVGLFHAVGPTCANVLSVCKTFSDRERAKGAVTFAMMLAFSALLNVFISFSTSLSYYSLYKKPFFLLAPHVSFLASKASIHNVTLGH